MPTKWLDTAKQRCQVPKEVVAVNSDHDIDIYDPEAIVTDKQTHTIASPHGLADGGVGGEFFCRGNQWPQKTMFFWHELSLYPPSGSLHSRQHLDQSDRSILPSKTQIAALTLSIYS